MSRSSNEANLDTFATVLGGVGGALLSDLLERLGVKPIVARAGVAIAGAAGAALLPGRLSCVSRGVAAAGVSDLALDLLAAARQATERRRQPEETAGSTIAGNDDRRNAEPPPAVDEQELADELPYLDSEEFANDVREELAEARTLAHFRTAGIERPSLPGWLPALAVTGLVLLPLVLQGVT